MTHVSKPRIEFSLWSRLSSSMLGLDPTARRAWLLKNKIDEESFACAEAAHLQEMAWKASEGDLALANEHSQNLRRKLAEEPLEASAAPDSTLDAPARNVGPSVPFVSGVFLPPSSPYSAAEVDPAGETLPIVGPKDDTLPFEVASGELRFLKLDAFARLSAELRQHPHRRNAILDRHGLSHTTFMSLAQLWATRFSETPWLRESFETLIQQRTQGRDQ